jgi:hypothetical protein
VLISDFSNKLMSSDLESDLNKDTAAAGYNSNVGRSQVKIWSTSQHPQIDDTRGTPCEQEFYTDYYLPPLLHGSDPAVCGRD